MLTRKQAKALFRKDWDADVSPFVVMIILDDQPRVCVRPPHPNTNIHWDRWNDRCGAVREVIRGERLVSHRGDRGKRVIGFAPVKSLGFNFLEIRHELPDEEDWEW